MQGVNLICLGSSSSGNGYLLDAGDEVLMIECGIGMTEVKKALNWNILNVNACLVSHHHQDHSKHLKQVVKTGIKVLALQNVIDARLWGESFKAVKPFVKAIEPMHGYKVGSFKVYAFDLSHANNDRSECPCVGFIIEQPKMGKLMFVTDTMMLRYSFPGVDHIMIEANYSDEILTQKIAAGETDEWERPRLLASHLELHQTGAILTRPQYQSAQEIVLLHLSSRHSDPEMFRNYIESTTGKPTYVAEPGMTLTLSKTPF